MANRDGGNSIISALVSAIVFLILILVLKWNFFVSAAIAILLYFAIFFLTSPVKKIGNIAVENIDQGERISKIYDKADKNIVEMGVFQKAVKDSEISSKAKFLTEKGSAILDYLTNNLGALSRSVHFLDYYLDTANRILENYVEMEGSRISTGNQELIKKETNESLDYLQDIFSKQLDSYYEDKILSLEVESDLLEKTVKLGGGRS